MKSKIEMRPEGESRGHKTLIIAKKCLHSKRTLLHTPQMHRCMVNEFPDLTQTVFIGHGSNLDTNKISHLQQQIVFISFQYLQN